MEKKSHRSQGDAAVKDLPKDLAAIQRAKDVKGGVNTTRFDPYKNFKF